MCRDREVHARSGFLRYRGRLIALSGDREARAGRPGLNLVTEDRIEPTRSGALLPGDRPRLITLAARATSRARYEERDKGEAGDAVPLPRVSQGHARNKARARTGKRRALFMHIAIFRHFDYTFRRFDSDRRAHRVRRNAGVSLAVPRVFMTFRVESHGRFF